MESPMQRLLAALLVLAMALAVVEPTLAQRDRGASPSVTPTAHDRGTHEPAQAKANSSRAAGHFAAEGDAVTGRYVRFTLDADACRIVDYAVYGTLLLGSVQLPESRCRLGRGDGSGVFSLRGNRSELTLHDAPNGLLHARARGGVVNVTLAAGLAASDSGGAVSFTAGNLTGTIFARRGPSNSSSALQWHAPVAALADGTLMVHPASGTSPERRQVLDAIRGGKVGAEADVLLQNGTVVSESFTFDEVELRMRRGGADRFGFEVSANLTEGRVFVANFDPAAWSPARLRVDYFDVHPDGSLNPVRIKPADSLGAVLAGQGDEALYFVFQDAAGWHVAVYVPNFSIHMFEVVGLPLQVVPLLLYGFVIVALVIGTGGIGVMLERRRVRAKP